MPKHINFEISFPPLLPWTLLEVYARWEEQIWCLNIKSIELKSPVSSICEMSSGRIDLCTFFGIWDTDRAVADCQHPYIFGTLVIFALQCSYMSLSLVSKLKLNTWVLKCSKYSSTPWGYSDTWVLHVALLKVLIFLAVVALHHPNSLACHINKFCLLMLSVLQINFQQVIVCYVGHVQFLLIFLRFSHY